MLASATSMPSVSATIVGPRPAEPTIALSTRSAPDSATSRTSPSGPASTSPPVHASAARAAASGSLSAIRPHAVLARLRDQRLVRALGGEADELEAPRARARRRRAPGCRSSRSSRGSGAASSGDPVWQAVPQASAKPSRCRAGRPAPRARGGGPGRSPRRPSLPKIAVTWRSTRALGDEQRLGDRPVRLALGHQRRAPRARGSVSAVERLVLARAGRACARRPRGRARSRPRRPARTASVKRSTSATRSLSR